MEYYTKVPCVLMRGGTSKGLIINNKHLPEDLGIRDKIIANIYGSPSTNQIDGVGGGTPVTSKIAIVEESADESVDIIYTFGQVSITEEKIDYKPTCGNISTAVGLYAVEEGLCKINSPVTTVRIFNTNTNKMIEVEVPTESEGIVYEGDYAIDGVPGTAPKINVNFLDSGGSITGALLPTGNVKDTVVLDSGESFEVSVIDSANTVIFITSDQLGIEGTEIGEAFNQKALLTKLERIRVRMGVKIGLIENEVDAKPTSHALPKIAVISKPQDYVNNKGGNIHKESYHISGRYVAMGALHPSFAVSGAIAIATGAQIRNTVISDLLPIMEDGEPIKIGHPSGIIEAEAEVEPVKGEYVVKRAAIGRTAKRILEGHSFVPTSLYTGEASLFS